MTNEELIEALADVVADMAASDRPSREIVIAIIRRWRDLGPSEDIYTLLRDEWAVPENITATVFNIAFSSLLGDPK